MDSRVRTPLPKCLKVGLCPAELFTVLDRNPVIEAEMTRPADRSLTDVLPRIREFHPLVRRNYESLVRECTAIYQTAEILRELEEVPGGGLGRSVPGKVERANH